MRMRSRRIRGGAALEAARSLQRGFQTSYTNSLMATYRAVNCRPETDRNSLPSSVSTAPTPSHLIRLKA